MFATVKQIFKPKNKDIQKKILFTFGALLIFKIGTVIKVPMIKASTGNLDFFEIFNAMSGGAFEKASIFALGVMPYITASIVIQLLSMDIVPYLSELRDQGGVGRNKLNTITRVTGIVLAFFQGFLYSMAFVQSKNPLDYMTYSLILTAGTCLLLWIGDQVTAKGIGNGISLIIMAGIVMTLPGMFGELWSKLVVSGNSFLGILTFIVYVLSFVAIIVGVIYTECAERRLPIQYSNKSTSMSGNRNYIPFKLNSAGVMPVIFASAPLSIIQILEKVINNSNFSIFVTNYLNYDKPVGLLIYIALIILFAYFYTFMQMKPKEIAENLNKNGGYILGVRPGKETEEYITKVLNRITIVGGCFLAILASLPILVSKFAAINTNVSISGTGLLIVVGVALETCRQLESELVSRTYTKGRRGK